MRLSPWLPLLLLTALHTLGNIAKPLHIDDTAYYYYARQAAQKPLDPYGFDVFWWYARQPANSVLAPPLLPYWWSLVLRLDGNHIWVWKIGMVPFSLLFSGALYALFRRFAPGLEMPLVWLTVLSPTFWPGLNLMLDIPCLALSLCALVVFLRACDRNSFGLAGLSGVLAGLAMETKYTAVLMPVVMLLYAAGVGRFRLWAAAALVATQMFVTWEILMAMLYGQSHFLYHYRLQVERDWLARLSLLPPLLGILGSIVPALVLLSLKSMRAPWPFLVAVALLGVVGYGLVAHVLDTKDTRLAVPNILGLDVPPEQSHLAFQEVWFGAWGGALALLIATTAALLLRLWPPPRRRFGQPRHPMGSGFRILNRRTFRITAFLVLWLCVEIAGYVALSPFAAVRRVLGVVLVGTLISGSLAARTCRNGNARTTLWGIVAYGALLGLGFTVLDWRDAQAQKDGVERAAAWLEGRGGTVWFTGHWGFQYYAEQEGMQPVVPTVSRLEPGDWLIVPYWIANQMMESTANLPVEEAIEIPIDDPIRLQTVMCYYSGATAVENRADPRLSVRIYRVLAPCTPKYR